MNCCIKEWEERRKRSKGEGEGKGDGAGAGRRHKNKYGTFCSEECTKNIQKRYNHILN